MSSHIDPEFHAWAQALVQDVERNLPEILEELRLPPSDFRKIREFPNPFRDEGPKHPLVRALERKPLLEYTIAKCLQNKAMGLSYATGFTEDEKRVFKGLPLRQMFLVFDHGHEEWYKRHRHKIAPMVEKYITLVLQGYKHEWIRKQLTPDERNILDTAKDFELEDAWQTVKIKPEIQHLLTKADAISGVYVTMPEEQLQAEAERASAEIYSATRTGGLMLFAPSGWGKSRLLGRSICYEYARNNIGTVVLDIVGGTIDNALDKIARHKPVSERQEIGSRIRYCNMAGERIGDEMYVTGWPMLVKRYPHESLHTTTQRIVDLIGTTDKALATASIQGFNRLAPLLTSVTTILAALELPLALSYELLSDPNTWKPRVERVGQEFPEASEAAADILAFYALDGRKQEERSEVLRNKLSFLKYDQISRAMFSAKEPLINWADVAERGLQVYIDLRNMPSQKALETSLFWVWNSLMEFIRSRGSCGRYQPPLAAVIDELSYFVRGTQLNTEAISEEFREFVQVRRRNANILLTAATQERAELPLTMQSACLQLPSHLYGATMDTETALENAKRWYKKEPTKLKSSLAIVLVKEYKQRFDDTPMTMHRPVLLEPSSAPRLEYMSLDEQDYENSRNFLELPKGEWLFAKSPGEGVPPTNLQHITTEKLDAGKYVREDVVAQFRRLLMQTHGVSVFEVLAEIEAMSEKIITPADEQLSAEPPPEETETALDRPDTPPDSIGQEGSRFGELPPD